MEAMTERFRKLSMHSRVQNGGTSMFTDKYIQQRFPGRPAAVKTPQQQQQHPSPTGCKMKARAKPATAPESNIRSSRSQFEQQVLPMKKKRRPSLHNAAPPPLRPSAPPRLSQQQQQQQQQQPRRYRTWQQSIPCKFSPKQPLLGRRRSCQSIPTVVKKPVHSSKDTHADDMCITSVCSTPTDEGARLPLVDDSDSIEVFHSKRMQESLSESVSAGPFPTSAHHHFTPPPKHHTSRRVQSMKQLDRSQQCYLLTPESLKVKSACVGEAFSFNDDEEYEDGNVLEDDRACFGEEELTDLEDGDEGFSGDESECSTSTIRDPLHAQALGRQHRLATAGGADQCDVAGAQSGPTQVDQGLFPSDDKQTWRASVFKSQGEVRIVPKSLSYPGTTSTASRCIKGDHKTMTPEASAPSRTLPLTTVCQPSATQSQQGISPATPSDLRGCEQATPPLTASFFSGRPPTIHFPLPQENYTPLPPNQRALLKWKMSSITPNVVKSCIARVGFSRCSKGVAWLGYWGKHMKAEAFKDVRVYQKVNHFPGTFQIGRKDRLWRNLSRMQARVGKKECDFVPLTYVLPQDLKLLRKEWEDGGARKQKWILKPPAAARGIGIKVVHRWGQVPKKRPVIVQRYVADPYLINGSKFDLRVYVYVSSYDPLRIYVFREGLARFATCKYSAAMKHLSNRFMHLTNYSINKRNTDFTPNTDETLCQGHKWGLLALWRYMHSELGVDTAAVWETIKDLVVKTIICSESYVFSLVKSCVKNSASVHELFGFDIMLDRRLKPWILEVNISPSLHSNSQLDVNIKGRMMRDLLNIAGFTLPTRQMLDGEVTTAAVPLTTEERIKHSHFLQKSLPEAERARILDSLTPDDLRTLMQAEDELARAGSFERVFPSASCGCYRRIFEMERYYNTLLEQWCKKYSKSPRKGIVALQKLAALHRV